MAPRTQAATQLNIAPSTREDATTRLRSIKGHVEGLLRMMERDDVYCVDALKQIKAVNGALNKTGDMILRCHLKHHVVTAHERGDEDRIIAELMELLKYR
ncbi:metal-sensitive transcriptional regulator [Oleiagrimonas sp.]|jgi:DNA-binding FrmR family transcriptional regulator|uniref:metal-sensitive transcriptional regulator n=1 Tax=Oleiagrimonas sp. TaxID=2010330 RepID=UPI00261C433C|nr:metal-sensitive transcriptional regulator [Oleiagrimonas sp.]MDA3914142.1 metal-sensitive transcriptional regulator [Oleiagrimonas sp.]